MRARVIASFWSDTEALQSGRVIGPVFFYLAPQLQKHFAIEHALQLLARRAADTLERGAVGADDDLFLAIAFDPDHRFDACDLACLLEFFYLHRQRVRQFLVQAARELFAHDLRGSE